MHLRRLRDYEGRTAAIDEVLAYAEKVGVRRQVRSRDRPGVRRAADERALRRARRRARQRRCSPRSIRKERLDTLSPRPVSIRYAATETGFAVAVRDRFGRLEKATILRYIDKCLHSPQQIDRKTYGAGLGLYLIANAATQFVVNVAPGMATEVVCTFDRKTRTRIAARARRCSSIPGGAEQLKQRPTGRDGDAGSLDGG